MEMPKSPEAQTRNALATIIKTLGEAGFKLSDIVRTRYIVPDSGDVEAVFDVLVQYLDDIRPAATMIIADLIRPEMKVEIEVTAFRDVAL